MTAGPASRIVTLLPRNKPTPIAPPIAIMVSWRWLKRRCKPSTSGVGDVSPASAVPILECWRSVITANTGRVENQEIQMLPQHFRDGLYIIAGVVHLE